MIPVTNCGPLSKIILSGNPCNFQILSLNNHASPSVLVLSVVGTKCVIFVNLSTTTRIESYPCAKGNFVMKSALMWVHVFSGIKFGINFPAGGCVQFLLHWQALHPSIYSFTSLVTPGHQKFLITNSTVFYCPPCPPTGVSWCSLITSTLNFSSLGTYTFPSFNIKLFSCRHSSSLNIFTLAHFIFSTAFITSLSLTSHFLTLSSKSIPSIMTSTTLIVFTSNHSFFTNVCSLLSFSTPIS